MHRGGITDLWPKNEATLRAYSMQAHTSREDSMRRLYNAVCEWLEASAEDLRRDEPDHPEGDNTTQLEHAHSYTSPPEMHAGQRHRSIDDDDSGTYRVSEPISLKWTGKQQ